MISNNNKTSWLKVKNKLLGNNAVVELARSENMTVCRYKIQEKAKIQMHNHDYEQIIYVIEGEMTLTVDGKTIFMKAGDVQVILSKQKHSADISKVPFQSFETYYPVRVDLELQQNLE